MQPSSVSISNPAAVSPFYLGVSFLICPALPRSLLPCQTTAHKQLRRLAGHVALPQKLKPMATCLVAAPEQTLRLPRLRMSILDPDGSTMDGARPGMLVKFLPSQSLHMF